jgi:transposase
MEPEQKVACGIDVAKATLAVCVVQRVGKRRDREFKNTAEGHRKLVSWVKSLSGERPVHYCMEATGKYGTALAKYLAAMGEVVSVSPPHRIKSYGVSRGVMNKTDKADAWVIAEFCRMITPAPWRPPQPEVEALTAMVRRLQDLDQERLREHNRLKGPGQHPQVQSSARRMLKAIEAEIRRLRRMIDEHVGRHPGLAEDKALLTTAPGIADKTALRLMAELPDARNGSSAKSAAALVGLYPVECASGTSVHKRARMSKAGTSQLRQALYMPAVVAIRCNPRVRDLYERLRARGLSKSAAIGAAMRKLLMIAFGILRTRTAFSPT